MMVRNIFVVALVSVFAIACTVHSDKITNRDAAHSIFGPALCEKLASCDASAFAIAFPGGSAECRQKFEADVADKDSLSGCDSAQWQACSTDYKNQQCPVPKTLPKSCDGC